jgi:hypothetical protein
MSISSVSSVNKYLLANSGPYVPPYVYTLIGSNVQFPTAYTGLEVAMSQITTYNRRIPFTPSTSTGWRNFPHELLVSSYQNYNNTQNGLAQDAFDNASSASSYWASNTASSQINYLDGVAQPHPTQNPYNISGVYVGGGGTGNACFYTTIHNAGSSDGEWLQIKFPYFVGLTEVNFIGRASAESGGPRDIDILGSQDGNSWTFLVNKTYPAYTYNTMNVGTFTLTAPYSYIRIVVKKVGQYGIGVASCQLKFNAYS